MKTTDLGHNWYYTKYDDGSAVIRNPEIGQRINLPKESVDTLKAIFFNRSVVSATIKTTA